MQSALADKQTQLTNQFAALEAALSQNQSESSWLTSQIAALPGVTRAILKIRPCGRSPGHERLERRDRADAGPGERPCHPGDPAEPSASACWSSPPPSSCSAA